MTPDRQLQIGRRHAAAVVGDPHQPLAAARRGDLDPGRAGVDGVFHQFLRGAGGSFDDLAGGDLVDEGF